MQLFYAPDMDPASGRYALSEEESRHCVRVLRLAPGDSLYLTDGRGTLCRAEVTDVASRRCIVEFRECTEGFGRRDWYLHVAVAPTKNMDRLEWFVEKATEIGIDRITPVVCDRSERRTVKTDRLWRVATGAVKQSLKAYHPTVDEAVPLRELVAVPFDGDRFVAHCEEGLPRRSLKSCLLPGRRIQILIGPEGDFSPEEIALASRSGFVPVSLGESRLRTETAALAAVHSVAFVNEK
ncbi:16S rRNA (uracil(1498)-N(3))-methyltransferase [uncultured Alistipes sp.]|uniref:16S rRNA (uracil(1498)-N(3))-methyltransferase n=1 Tax=uncultured Alistipes sp. TaxID=538949 RepID=UPI00262D8A02|nr:16S rRNA (uracil(1498)-N(3))-methyltransferase [uncultured Alistipes sp.]